MGNKGRIVGFTCGAWDLLHAGHILALHEAAKHCDRLIVGLQTDPSIDRPGLKNKPIQSLRERFIHLAAVKYVDQIVVYNTEADLEKLLISLRPDVRIIGADWRGKSFTGHQLDIPVVFTARNHRYSTSELRQRVCRAQQEQ